MKMEPTKEPMKLFISVVREINKMEAKVMKEIQEEKAYLQRQQEGLAGQFVECIEHGGHREDVIRKTSICRGSAYSRRSYRR